MNGHIWRYVIVTVLFLGLFLFQSANYQASAANKVSSCVIKAEGYTLQCGVYKGYETDYDHTAQKVIKKEVKATLFKNKIIINGITTKFKIQQNKLYADKTALYEIIGNNKLLMLAGGGIIFEHE